MGILPSNLAKASGLPDLDPLEFPLSAGQKNLAMAELPSNLFKPSSANLQKSLTMINNSLYIRRRSKIALPDSVGAEELSQTFIGAALKNLESLGFFF